MSDEIIKIHPFDVYVMVYDLRDDEITPRGTMAIERSNVPEPYTVNETVFEIRGKKYCETTTVPYITDKLDKFIPDDIRELNVKKLSNVNVEKS